ncbi:CRISPR-associated protein [Cyanobacterium aponinum]|nr:CRISPR-associated protein [Cyanobacterium aponinum]
MQIIISSVGTSLLTHQIDRTHPDERNWYNLLRDTANLTLENTPENVKNIIYILKNRAIEKLNSSSIVQIRDASAELNGIYGFYDNNLTLGKNGNDFHWLICTDTLQGKTTGEIVESFLKNNGISSECLIPQGLSTINISSFSNGIDNLLTQLENIIYQDKTVKVCFNLVGGFKSLQGYLNTIGMLYADEIIYIFEGKNSELIRIPRLPIKVDESIIEPNIIEFALMSQGEISANKIKNIKESLVYIMDNEATLSNWGKVIWNNCKHKFLTQELLNFPFIKYTSSFINDYNNITLEQEKIKLQETLAKVSYLLSTNNGNRAVLRNDKALQYETFNNKSIDHFRVTGKNYRVSCEPTDNNILLLRYYGTHDHIFRRENIKRN